ncbi:MAG: NifB/NifX family molybdenum-iron cluster-binding protein [Methanocella sp.]
MKICIPKSDVKVTRHFGKAPEFALFTVEEGKVTATETVPNPGREKVDVPVYVAGNKVTHVIASGIGDKAIGMLHERNIEVFKGAVGNVDTVLDRFLRGELKHNMINPANEHVCENRDQ